MKEHDHDQSYQPLDLDDLFNLADVLRDRAEKHATFQQLAPLRKTNAVRLAELVEPHRGGWRLCLPGERLELRHGRLITRVGGHTLEIARAPSGRAPQIGQQLVITSSVLSTGNGVLVARCTGPCAGDYPVHSMGLRWAARDLVRNQPQCPQCRRRPRRTTRRRDRRRSTRAAPRCLRGVIERIANWDTAQDGMELDELPESVREYLGLLALRPAPGATP